LMVLFTCNVVAIVDFIACCMVVNRLVCLTEPIRNEYISIHYKIERTKRQTIFNMNVKYLSWLVIWILVGLLICMLFYFVSLKLVFLLPFPRYVLEFYRSF
jgi:hypothetical protein